MIFTMNNIHLFFIFSAASENLKLWILKQGAKQKKHDIDDGKVVLEYFGNRGLYNKDISETIGMYDVYKYKAKGAMVAYLMALRKKVLKNTSKGEASHENADFLDVVALYSFWVREDFRKKGIGTKLLQTTLKDIKEKFYKNKDFIVVLSANPKEKYALVSYGFYYKIGLRKGDYMEFKDGDYEDICRFEEFKDVKEVIYFETPAENMDQILMSNKYSEMNFKNPEKTKSFYEDGDVCFEKLHKNLK